MIVDLPSTDTSAVNRTMVDLRESAGAVALGRVLTLLIITEDGPDAEAAIQAANDASREHPCRVIVLARGIRRAAVAAGRPDPHRRRRAAPARSSCCACTARWPTRAASIVVPLLLPDAPIVAWWPGEAPTSPSEDPVGSVARRAHHRRGLGEVAVQGAGQAAPALRARATPTSRGAASPAGAPC